MQCFISGIELQISEDKISVMLNNCFTWSAEEFAARFVEVCAEFLAQNAADLQPCISDGFGLFFMAKLLGLGPDA